MESAPFTDAVAVALRNGYGATVHTASSIFSRTTNRAISTADSTKIIVDAILEWLKVQPFWVFAAMAAYLLLAYWLLKPTSSPAREDARSTSTSAKVHIDNPSLRSTSHSPETETPTLQQQQQQQLGAPFYPTPQRNHAAHSSTSHAPSSLFGNGFGYGAPQTPVRQTALGRVTAHGDDDAPTSGSPIDVSALRSTAPATFATLQRMGMFDKDGSPTKRLLERSGGRAWTPGASPGF